MDISVQSLTHSFFENPLLSNITFSISPGEYIGIIGENGSGKSTLVKLLLGLIPIQSGSVLFDSKYTPGSSYLRGKIGYVPQYQNHHLIDTSLTVADVLDTGDPRLFSKSHKKYVEVLSYVDMIGSKCKIFGHLSGGQRQRVLIARALINSPSILVLDEPTNGVDTDSQSSVYQILQQLKSEKQTTVLHITHDIQGIEKIADRVLCIENSTLCTSYSKHEHVHSRV